MKLLIILNFICINVYCQNYRAMDDIKVLSKTELDFKKINFLKRIDFNSANLFENKSSQEYIIYPQKGKDAIILKNKQVLENLLSDNSFPILIENNNIYFQSQKILNVINNHFSNNDKIIEEAHNLFKIDLGKKIDLVFLTRLEKDFKNLSKEEKEKIFPYLLLFFCDFFQNSLSLNIEQERQEYLLPHYIPYLYDNKNEISLFILNENLYNKCIFNQKKTFKNIIIDSYCYYYNQRFLLTDQNNYFVKNDYKKELVKNFDIFFIFPFKNIWHLEK